MSIGQNIKKLREHHQMSQEELARIAGVTDKAVSTWETGKNEPRMGVLQKIADYFGIPKSQLIEGPTALAPSQQGELSLQEQRLLRGYRSLPLTVQEFVLQSVEQYVIDQEPQDSSKVLPLFDNWISLPIGGNVACGAPISACEDSYSSEDMVLADPKYEGMLALHVCGDSMEPRFPDGSHIIVKKQSQLEDGQIGVFMLDNQFSCKKFKVEQGQVSLLSLNPNYDPIVLSQEEYEEVLVYGLVVGNVE